MIDASRSPRPIWKRFTTLAVLAALVLVALLMIWKKELHHPSPSDAAPVAPAATAPAPSAQPGPGKTESKSNSIPGGIPVSNRDPFQG